MLTALHGMLASMPATTGAIEALLPRVTRLLQDEFVYWVDGGAGVGTTSASYAATLKAELLPEHQDKALVACYEPLPENAAVLRERFAGDPHYLIREVALSSMPGQASFAVPDRFKGQGSGVWAPGTSYSGSLKYGAGNGDTVTVETVRLADEAIPRFDFVKLDLQGGELDALQGLGSRLQEAKLLYVETQLLRADWGALRFLADNGFVLLYDRLQFGFRPSTQFVPLELLRECGIVIERIHLPQASGMPFICWGRFETTANVFDPGSLLLRPELSKRLQDAGVAYMQTDTVGVNARYAPLILQSIAAW